MEVWGAGGVASGGSRERREKTHLSNLELKSKHSAEFLSSLVLDDSGSIRDSK